MEKFICGYMNHVVYMAEDEKCSKTLSDNLQFQIKEKQSVQQC